MINVFFLGYFRDDKIRNYLPPAQIIPPQLLLYHIQTIVVKRGLAFC